MFVVLLVRQFKTIDEKQKDSAVIISKTKMTHHFISRVGMNFSWNLFKKVQQK